MPELTFKREERLKSEKIIGALFRIGASVGAFPLRAIWLPLKFDNGPFPIQVSISVPKKAFKKAVDRNRIRRQIREAWRLQKSLFYEKLDMANRRLALMIIYTAKEPVEYRDIEKGIRKMIFRIGEALEKTTVAD